MLTILQLLEKVLLGISYDSKVCGYYKTTFFFYFSVQLSSSSKSESYILNAFWIKFHAFTSLQHSWRWGTRRWSLRVPDLQISCNDLPYGNRDNSPINILNRRQNCRSFADHIFNYIFLNENVWISQNISLKCVRKVRINNIPALVQIMAWRRPGDKPLSEPMVVSLPSSQYILTHHRYSATR